MPRNEGFSVENKFSINSKSTGYIWRDKIQIGREWRKSALENWSLEICLAIILKFKDENKEKPLVMMNIETGD